MKLIPKGNHISKFKSGDLLRRTIPIKDDRLKGRIDNSFIETPIIFRYIMNNKIYYEYWIEFKSEFTYGIDLDLDIWGNNWIKVNKI